MLFDRPSTLRAQIGGSVYRVRFLGGCCGDEVVVEGVRLFPFTCGLLSDCDTGRGGSVSNSLSAILRFVELAYTSISGSCRRISPLGWLGRRVFGLTLKLRSLSLCDLLFGSLVDVLCES